MAATNPVHELVNAVSLSDSRRLLATLIRLGRLLVELLHADRHTAFCRRGCAKTEHSRGAPGQRTPPKVSKINPSPFPVPIWYKLDPQFVSRKLGYSNPSVTLGVYSHLFVRRNHGDLARQALDASYEAMRNSTRARTTTLAVGGSGVA